MSESSKHIDELYQEQLGNHAEMPPASVWESLELRLDEDDDKGGGFGDDRGNGNGRPRFPLRWWWVLLGLLLFVGTAVGINKLVTREEAATETTTPNQSQKNKAAISTSKPETDNNKSASTDSETEVDNNKSKSSSDEDNTTNDASLPNEYQQEESNPATDNNTNDNTTDANSVPVNKNKQEGQGASSDKNTTTSQDNNTATTQQAVSVSEVATTGNSNVQESSQTVASTKQAAKVAGEVVTQTDIEDLSEEAESNNNIIEQQQQQQQTTKTDEIEGSSSTETIEEEVLENENKQKVEAEIVQTTTEQADDIVEMLENTKEEEQEIEELTQEQEEKATNEIPIIEDEEEIVEDDMVLKPEKVVEEKVETTEEQTEENSNEIPIIVDEEEIIEEEGDKLQPEEEPANELAYLSDKSNAKNKKQRKTRKKRKGDEDFKTDELGLNEFNTLTPKPPKPRRLELGIKAGYQYGFNNSAKADKFVISPYLQYMVVPHLSLVFQPSYLWGTAKVTTFEPVESYYDVTSTSLDSTRLVIKGDTFQNIPDSAFITYVYSKQYDSTYVSYELKQKQLWDIELPLMLQYDITPNFSIYGGASITFSKVLTLRQTVSNYNNLIVRDSNSFLQTYPANAAPPPAPTPQDPASYFANYGTPISQYKPYINNTQNSFSRVGFMLGFRYTFAERYMVDMLYQQSAVNKSVITDTELQKVYSQPYMRITLGYKLYK